MGLDHRVYISLKRLEKADNEWHAVVLHTGRFDKLDSGSLSKGEVTEVSVCLSKRVN